MNITKATQQQTGETIEPLFISWGNFPMILIKPFLKLNTQVTPVSYLSPATSTVFM